MEGLNYHVIDVDKYRLFGETDAIYVRSRFEFVLNILNRDREEDEDPTTHVWVFYILPGEQIADAVERAKKYARCNYDFDRVVSDLEEGFSLHPSTNVYSFVVLCGDGFADIGKDNFSYLVDQIVREAEDRSETLDTPLKYLMGLSTVIVYALLRFRNEDAVEPIIFYFVGLILATLAFAWRS
jgi:hypothetical protein